MLWILTYYLLRNAITGTLFALMVLLAIAGILEFVSEVDNIGKGTYQMVHAVMITFSRLPQMGYNFLPVAALIGTLMGLGQLAAGSELIAVRAAGVSLWKLSGILVLGGILMGSVGFSLGEWIAPQGRTMARQLKNEALQRPVNNDKAGMWLRDGEKMVHFAKILTQNHAQGITILTYDTIKKAQLTQIQYAERADYRNGAWYFTRLLEQNLSLNKIQQNTFKNYVWQTQISPHLLDSYVIEPEDLSLSGLWQYSDYLRKNGLDDTAYLQSFWRKLVKPFSVLVLCCFALPFVLGNLRHGGAGQRLFIGVILGVVFHLLNEISGNTGQVYGLAPWFSAALPTVILLLILPYLLKRAA